MYLITGGNGQLGTELRHLLDETGVTYVSTDSQEMDITDAKATMTKDPRNQTQGYFPLCGVHSR